MRGLLGRLALVALGAALAVGLAEIVLMVADVAPPVALDARPYWSIRHGTFGWWYVPGVTFRYNGSYQKFGARNTINSKGLREREYAYEKDDGIFRILILGDSLTASFEVPLEQTWHEVLEATLIERRLRPGRVEVIAAGVQGWSTDQEYLYYLHEGYKYRPDLVLLQFYPNDIYGNSVAVQQLTRNLREIDKPFFVLDGNRLVQTDPFRSGEANQASAPRPGVLRRVKNALRDHLRTYRLASRVKQSRVEQRRPRVPFCYEYAGVPPELHTYAAEAPREYTAAWDVTSRIIEELSRETARRGQWFAVVYLPDRRQVLAEEWQRTLRCWPAAAQLAWNLDRPNRALNDLLARIGVPYLDLTAPFRTMTGAGGSVYFESDWHLNPDGHRLVSSLLIDWLRRESLIHP